MPKAYDDESEFASEPAKELVQLSAWQRVRVLVSGKYLALTVALAFGIISLISSLLSVTSTPSIPERPFAQIGRMINEDALAIAGAHNEIRKQLEAIPDSDTKRAIIDQLNLINRAAGGLKAMGDAFTSPPEDKRSSLELISTANAQATSPSRLTPDDVRLYGVIVILFVLGAAFLLCIGMILFSNHARRLTFAIDTVKVLMGFFVGVATSFFGVR